MFKLYKISNIIVMITFYCLFEISFNWIQGSKSLCTNEGLKEYLRGQVKCYSKISYGGYGVMVVM